MVVAMKITRPENKSTVYHLGFFQAVLTEISNSLHQSKMKSKDDF